MPHRHDREHVEVVVGTDRVEVWLRGTRIASHARSFEPGAWVRDPAHFEGLYRTDEKSTTTRANTSEHHSAARPLSAYTAIVEGGRP